MSTDAKRAALWRRILDEGEGDEGEWLWLAYYRLLSAPIKHSALALP